jgi:hypothetical protein
MGNARLLPKELADARRTLLQELSLMSDADLSACCALRGLHLAAGGRCRLAADSTQAVDDKVFAIANHDFPSSVPAVSTWPAKGPCKNCSADSNSVAPARVHALLGSPARCDDCGQHICWKGFPEACISAIGPLENRCTACMLMHKLLETTKYHGEDGMADFLTDCVRAKRNITEHIWIRPLSKMWKQATLRSCSTTIKWYELAIAARDRSSPPFESAQAGLERELAKDPFCGAGCGMRHSMSTGPPHVLCGIGQGSYTQGGSRIFQK